MTSRFRASLPIAAISLTLLCPGFALAQSDNTNNDQNQTAGRQEVREMVRAQVALSRGLDARKDQEGAQFETRLERTVHLKNGPELPKGTMLVGKVTADDMNESGKSKLALQFTEAKLKNGSTVPIHATIVEVYPRAGMTAAGEPIPEESAPRMDADGDVNDWNRQTLRVDQIGALKDVDLHSNVASRNSGVFVSTKRDDVKLMQGSQLELALSGENSVQQGQNGSGNSQ